MFQEMIFIDFYPSQCDKEVGLAQSRSPRFFRLNQQVPQQSDPLLGMGRNCNKRRAPRRCMNYRRRRSAFTIAGACVCLSQGWTRAIDIDAAQIHEGVEKYPHVAEVPGILSADQMLLQHLC